MARTTVSNVGERRPLSHRAITDWPVPSLRATSAWVSPARRRAFPDELPALHLAELITVWSYARVPVRGGVQARTSCRMNET